ncbi:MAG: hypothetical protein HY326_05855, partial [Chloroflexi bacterium]|nr:hypothetical protein [Chloroflexota bacterium]
MHLFLFLDDWMLDGYQDIVRRFPHPIPATVPLWEDAHNHATVIRDPETGLYRCWYRRFYGNGGDNRAALCVAESVDGYHWQPLNHQGPKDPGLPGRSNTLDIPQRPDGSGQARVHVVFRDDSDPDASRRYKGVDYYGWLLFSPDGIRWRIDPACQAFKIASGSDTKNNLFWNPVKKQYQVHHRPVNVDRRVALSTSPDLKNWNYEGIVFQPDAMDPPLLEIYSMVTFWYEDIFIAFPGLFRTPMG